MDLAVILSVLFLITFMFWVGLETQKRELVDILQDRALFRRGLLANIVLVPMLGFLLNKLFRLPSQTSTGFLLLALTPGGLFALNFVRVAKGHVAFAIELIFLLSGVAVFFTPLISRWLLNDEELHSRVLLAFGLLCAGGFGPLLTGLWLKTEKPELCNKLKKPLNLASLLIFIIANLAAIKVRNPALKIVDRTTIVAMVLLIIGSWAIGWALGGEHLNKRKTLAIATSIRNVAIALPIANSLPHETGVLAVVVAFSGIVIPMNVVFAFILHRLEEHHHRTEPRMA